MRMMVQVQIPAEAGNRAFKDGTFASTMEKAVAELKPEAVYFGPFEGNRTAFFVVQMKEADELPFVAERFFSGFGAKIVVTPVMTPDDLRKGLSRLG